MDREIAKKIALEKWHQQKKDEERRRRRMEKIRVKTDRRNYFQFENEDEKFKEYEIK